MTIKLSLGENIIEVILDMMKKTHTAIGIAAAIAIINTFSLPYVSIIGVIGANAPDWDFKLGLKHRTITHSLLLLCLSSFAVSFFSKNIAVIWFVSYLLHLLADSFTKMGVPLMIPTVMAIRPLKICRYDQNCRRRSFLYRLWWM